jgi:hypothetical protein
MAATRLIIGVIYGLIIHDGRRRDDGGGGRNSGPAGRWASPVGLMVMVAIPIFYGVIGFIGGIIGVIYNLASGVVGGIELELRTWTAGSFPAAAAATVGRGPVPAGPAAELPLLRTAVKWGK